MVPFRRLLQIFMLLLAPPLAADIEHGADPETGLRSWRLAEGILELELIQRLPDQTRAFFLARDFSAEIADEIAGSCIFQTIIRNTGRRDDGARLAIDQTQWRVIRDDTAGGIRLKEPWLASWPPAAASQASRLAFRWALFPTRQEFLPGDYNWGMTAFGPPPGAVFDLEVVWRADSVVQSSRIKAIECAPDVERLQ